MSSSILPAVQALLARPQFPQLTPAWFQSRRSKLTASMIAGVLMKTEETLTPYLVQFPDAKEKVDTTQSCSPYETLRSSMRQKVGLASFKGNAATLWGQKMEQAISDWYGWQQQSRVLEVGLLEHPTVEFLAASPDGVLATEARLLEIKCPLHRRWTSVPPFFYWIQCQIQMEVCDMPACDFIEAEIQEFYSYESRKAFLSKRRERGILATGLLMEVNQPPFALKDQTYRYAPAGMTLTQQLEWLQKTHSTLEPTQLGRPVFWVASVSIKSIPRSTEWFEAILPRLTWVHQQLLHYQTPEGKKELEEVTLEEALVL